MDTRFLETFLLCVECGNMAEAARRLHVTPAAVGQRIRALEAEVGEALMVRSGRVMQPTEGGLAILSQSRAILQAIGDLKALAAGDGLAGELRLGAISTALTGILPPVLTRLARTLPQASIYLVPGTSIDLYRKLTDGDIHAAVIINPPFTLPKGYDWRGIRREPLVLVAPAALAGGDPHELLATQPLIRYDRNNWGGALADSYMRSQRLRPLERFELDSLDAILVLVSAGMGISLIPDWMPPWPENLSITKYALPEDAPYREIGTIWPRNSPVLKLINAFNRAMAELAPPRAPLT